MVIPVLQQTLGIMGAPAEALELTIRKESLTFHQSLLQICRCLPGHCIGQTGTGELESFHNLLRRQ
jgi:hypothetical protein